MAARKKTTHAKVDAAAIRPRSSLRKGRSATIDHAARQPRQDRSRERFERVLTAAEEVLQVANIEDISLYDIARQGKLSPASISYLFPTMAALRIELNRRYNETSVAAVREVQLSVAKMRNPRWQDWIAVVNRQVRDYCNRNRHVCEVIYGPALHRESLLENIRANAKVGESSLESLRQVFVVPEIPGLVETFALMAHLTDALWARSYTAHRRIDDNALEDSNRLQITYLRTILPEVLPLNRMRKARGAG